MKIKFVLLLLSITLSSVVHAGRESGGGDTFSIEFVQVAQQVTQYLKGLQNSPIDIAVLDEAITKTKIESTLQTLSLDNIEKDAINYPGEKKIVFNSKRWSATSNDLKPAIVLHEYLGIMRIDDVGYKVSKKVIGTFQYKGSADENFLRGVLSTTNIFPTIQDKYEENLGEGVGFILVGAVASDEATTNNKLLVIGLPTATSDFKSSIVKTNLEEIKSVTLVGVNLVVSGLRVNHETEESEPVKVFIQIKNISGSDQYLNKLIVRF